MPLQTIITSPHFLPFHVCVPISLHFSVLLFCSSRFGQTAVRRLYFKSSLALKRPLHIARKKSHAVPSVDTFVHLHWSSPQPGHPRQCKSTIIQPSPDVLQMHGAERAAQKRSIDWLLLIISIP